MQFLIEYGYLDVRGTLDVRQSDREGCVQPEVRKNSSKRMLMALRCLPIRAATVLAIVEDDFLAYDWINMGAR